MKDKSEYTEEDHRALKDFSLASETLRKVSGGKVGEGAESKYGQTYARCYQLGLKQYNMQICKTTR